MGFAGRYGGEEFCLLLPNTGATRALEIGEMVRTAVQGLAMPPVTSSFQIVTRFEALGHVERFKKLGRTPTLA